jgi:hypothetical protein
MLLDKVSTIFHSEDKIRNKLNKSPCSRGKPWNAFARLMRSILYPLVARDSSILEMQDHPKTSTRHSYEVCVWEQLPSTTHATDDTIRGDNIDGTRDRQPNKWVPVMLVGRQRSCSEAINSLPWIWPRSFISRWKYPYHRRCFSSSCWRHKVSCSPSLVLIENLVCVWNHCN